MNKKLIAKAVGKVMPNPMTLVKIQRKYEAGHFGGEELSSKRAYIEGVAFGVRALEEELIAQIQGGDTDNE